MGSIATPKPHAVCIPFPAQGHITPMLQLAKLLHSRGFHITFVNSEYNHQRFLKLRGPSSLDSLPNFRFDTIPDGLPQTDEDVTQDIPSLCESTTTTCLVPFRNLLDKLNAPGSGVPPVTCIVSDGVMSFTLDAAQELGIPEAIFWTTSACGYMGYVHYEDLVQRGFTPLRDVDQLTNGYLETPVDGIAGMKNMRLRDFPSFIRTTDPNDFMLNFVIRETKRIAHKASAVILNTFHDFEQPVLDAKLPAHPPIYPIGPLCLLSTSKAVNNSEVSTIRSNLWKEDTTCLDWLEAKAPGSVVYVNFGSITVVTNQQMVEFAWGLANSKYDFLWVIRPDLVRGESAMLPAEFLEETKGRGLIVSWCPQEQVLAHPAVSTFLTHSGWNSTLESICGGVPMICWPFFAEQQTNCRYACTEWGVGMEIDSNVMREEVEGLIIEMMDGESGKEMKKNAIEWKEKAIISAVNEEDGNSSSSLDSLINGILLSRY